MPPERVSRFDVAEIGKPTRTPQGFLRVPAFLTRAGVFTYRRADGTTIREYRPRDEVFAPASLATLAAAPVTDLHPSEMITPANVRKHSVGHVSERVRADGNFVAAEITVQDADVIARVERRERREVSCGYQCKIDATPGTYNGEAYDVVQRDIVYNHAALGPQNWGRAGRDVALRVDSKDAPEHAFCLEDAADAVLDAPFEQPAERADGGIMDPVTIRVDGIDVQVPKQSAQLFEVALKKRDDSVTALTKERDTLQGKCDSVTAELAEAKKKLEAAQDPKRMDAMINARATLLEQARRVLPAEHKFDGQTDRQIQEAVLVKMDDKLDLKGKSDEYVQARFDHAIETVKTDAQNEPKGSGSRLDSARRATTPGGTSNQPRTDSVPYVAPWQKPLSMSKDKS